MKTNLRSVLTGAVLALGAAVPLVLAVEAAHQPACDRACLLAFTGDYLDAMLAHHPAALKTASDLKATENGKPVSLGEGLWKSVRAIPSHAAFADPSTGEAGLFALVQEEDGETYRLALRLKIDRQRIEELETVISPGAATLQ